MKKYKFINFTALIFIVALATSLAFAEQGGKGTSTSNKTQLVAGDSYDLYINNVDLPLNRSGVLAAVTIGRLQPGGKLGGTGSNNSFLFSGGFLMSGYTNGALWANGVMSASRVGDYVPGTYASGQNDPTAQLYVVKSSDPDFSQSWIDWKAAVALGADFYDGDGDGIYNPVDKNGNGKWDPNEDRPDLIGDATVWCVYSDLLSSPLRLYSDVSPQGIEVRQTVFAFNSKAAIGNMIFVRYKIVNVGISGGGTADVLDSVYFGVADDPDVGDSGANDLVGCDTTLNAGFTYHKVGAGDGKWGSTPPCFLVDFFQGPKSYIPGVTFNDINGDGIFNAGDTAIDTATDVRGKVMGIQQIPGAKNMGISSFVQYYNGIDPNNRFQCRYYNLGRTRDGSLVDPCTYGQGTVSAGVNCKLVDPLFMFSGDPVTGIGWVNSSPQDQRQITNTGPFKLVKNDTVTIVVAYIVGKGTDYLNSVTVAKTIDKTAKKLFKANFPSLPPPPAVAWTSQTGDGFIDFTWPTTKNIKYNAIDSVFYVNRNVHGFYITQYFTNVKAVTINNQPNSMIIARYDLRDSIQDLYALALNGGIDLKEASAPAGNKLDSLVAIDTTAGRVKFRLSSDPSTNNALIKGHQYYFTVTEYTVNNWSLVDKATGVYDGKSGDYYDPSGGGIEEFESPLMTVTMNSDEYNPVTLSTPSTKTNGPSSGSVKYVVVDQTKLTGNTYKVDFFSDTNPLDGYYNPYWSLTNTQTGKVWVDSSQVYNFDTTNYAGTPIEGFIPRIQPLIPTMGSPVYSNNGVVYPTSKQWYTAFGGVANAQGAFYLGLDVPAPSPTSSLGAGIGFDSIKTLRSKSVTANRLRQVELRFGDSSYAYRYVNGVVGTVVGRLNSTVYAGGIKGTDTVASKPHIGNWDVVNGHANGFVKIPFSAWVVDSANIEKRRLAVGFIERSAAFGGNPDGNWDPGLSVLKSWEVILVFDSPYDSTGSQIQYTGNSSAWAQIVNGYTLNAPVSDSLKSIASSPWLNTLYLVAMQRKDTTGKFFVPGDKLTIPITTYPYTSTDEYRFTTQLGGTLSTTSKKSLFDKVNVYPNPLYGYNSQTSYNPQGSPDAPFVTFSNLPDQVVTINIFTLSGTRIRTLTTDGKSPFIQWNLQNEAGLRAASGMYLAIVSCPGYGDKVLKFAIIMPQKQIKSY